MAVTPTAPTAEVSHLGWLVRRESHPEAPGLVDLVDDVGRFRARDVYRAPSCSSATTGRDPARFATVDGLWDDLLGRSTRRPAFRLVREGTTLDATRLSRSARVGNRDLTDLISPDAVVAGYRGGATIVLQGLHLTDPALARFATNLALDLDQPIQINAYLSPASARGLDVHFDFHDVFVVQLGGTKRWRVWAPSDATLDPIPGAHAPTHPTLDELGDPLLDLVLQPGDVLYVPRGHPHVAETTDRSSGHLTVGVLAITWHRVVRRAIDAAMGDGRLRASIPLSTLAPDTEPAVERVGGPAPDLDVLDLDLATVDLRRWVTNEIWRRQAVTRVRPLGPVDAAAADGPLRFTPGPLLALTSEDDRAVLVIGDRHLSLPAEAHPFLAALLTTNGPCHRVDLPGLDDGSSRVVVDRLLDEGILAPVSTRDAASEGSS
jgi:hypothetical protein